jgi:hypothetical protein
VALPCRWLAPFRSNYQPPNSRLKIHYYSVKAQFAGCLKRDWSILLQFAAAGSQSCSARKMRFMIEATKCLVCIASGESSLPPSKFNHSHGEPRRGGPIIAAQGGTNVSNTSVGVTLGFRRRIRPSVEEYGIHHNGAPPRSKSGRGCFRPRPTAVMAQCALARPTEDENRYPGLRDVRFTHAPPPWAEMGPPRWGFCNAACMNQFVGVARQPPINRTRNHVPPPIGMIARRRVSEAYRVPNRIGWKPQPRKPNPNS